MIQTLNLHTYDGRRGVVDVDDAGLMVIVRYTVSGDDCFLLIYEDGHAMLYDSEKLVEDAVPRVVSCGPENITIILPEDMRWGSVNEA